MAKPGRHEIMSLSGVVDNSAMTSASVNRNMQVVAPSSQYNVPPTITPTVSTDDKSLRDNPGVYRDFGNVYLRSSPSPSIPGAISDGMPTYDDYSTTTNPDGSHLCACRRRHI